MTDRVVLITGAARGVGRGIALALAEPGVIIYLTDRESRTDRHSPLPGTVEDTADQVAARGGRAVPLVVDHSDDAAIAAAVGLIDDTHDGLDLLVANASNGNALPFTAAPFWELPMVHWTNMIDIGLRSHLVVARLAAPALIKRRGLVIMTGYADDDSIVIAGHLFYDLAMTGVNRLCRTMAHDFSGHGVSVVTVSPGITRTEAVLAAVGDHPMPPGTDSIEFPGRAVRALWHDPDVAQDSGRTITVADLALRYGFDDVPAGRS